MHLGSRVCLDSLSTRSRLNTGTYLQSIHGAFMGHSRGIYIAYLKHISSMYEAYIKKGDKTG